MHSVDLNDIYKASRSKETLKSETTNDVPLESLQTEFKTDIKHLTKADAKETRKAGLALTQELKELSKNPLEANSSLKTYLLQKNDLDQSHLVELDGKHFCIRARSNLICHFQVT